MTNAEIMEKAQAEIAGTLDQIRRDTSRTEAWKKQEIARAYQRMRQRRDRLTEERDERSAQASTCTRGRPLRSLHQLGRSGILGDLAA